MPPSPGKKETEMSPEDLQELPRTRLAQIAKDQGISSWSSLSKPELITELSRPRNEDSDRLDVIVEDAHWLDIRWVVSPATLERMATAFGSRWRAACPILQIFLCGDLETSVPSRRRMLSIPVPKGTAHWHVHIERPGETYQIELGFGIGEQDYHPIAHSGLVRTLTPRNQTNGHKPVSPIALTPSTNGRLMLSVQSELHLHGQTSPGATLRVDDEIVPVDREGRFELRRPLEEGRTMLPIVSSAADGVEQRTIAMVVEHHARELEPDRPRKHDRHRR
jgi:hypothetical protein